MRRFLIASALVLAASMPLAASAQTVPPFEAIKTEAELTRAVTELDRQLFDAYNTCNLEKFNSFFADDVEFYHDQGGLTLGNKALTESVKKNICGTTQRVLVPGTLQVYPMKGYGAVEMGIHRFTHPWKQDHGVVGEGRFITLWQYKDGAWKITRAISYDHHLAK
ncbi:MAG TPA: nuclear transport factor 2 family protein [Edaphobacter sp.]|jgi:hypothetical protein